MGQMMIFQDPALAQALREAGFAVFKQNYNGVDCFAVEQTAALTAQLPHMMAQFGHEQFAVARSRTVHF